ncbi:MAG: CcmD family protein [Candidatus Binataceae bacterium]|nr:CcmD family protein [Candidatus Binataceae bacterium]
MENLGYLFAAYTIIFGVIFLYVLFIWRRQARLERELRALETRLEAVRGELAARGAPPSPPAA